MSEQDTPISFWDAVMEQKGLRKDAKIHWLLMAVRDQHTKAVTLANAVLDYAWHAGGCGSSDGGLTDCTCGYAEAVRLAKELAGDVQP